MTVVEKANESWVERQELITPEYKAAEDKIAILDKTLKASIPKELHKLLFELGEANSELIYLIAETNYLDGYVDGTKGNESK